MSRSSFKLTEHIFMRVIVVNLNKLTQIKSEMRKRTDSI